MQDESDAGANLESERPGLSGAMDESLVQSLNSLSLTAPGTQAKLLEVLFSHALGPLVLLDRQFNFLWVNEAYAKAGQREIRDFISRNHFELYPSDAQAIFEEVVRTKIPHKAVARPFVYADRPERGTTYWDWTLTPILDQAGEVEFLVFSLEDVTQRRLADLHAKATNRLLRLSVTKPSRKAYLEAVAELLRDVTGSRCVGVRLRNTDGEVPYEASLGFGCEFLATECWLHLDRDQCACTRAIAGQPSPDDLSALTPSGSFCLNDTLRFVGGLSDEARKGFRGICLQSGYLSVAVFPIRSQEGILGAIHLADERPGMFAPSLVAFLESVAPLIGEAVHRFNMEDALRESDRQLRTLNLTLERRAEQLRAMASELTLTEQRERRRLAQILHDHLQQLLVAARIKLGILRRRQNAAELGKALMQLDELLNESIRASRSLTVDLSPPILYDAGLHTALEWLARHVLEKHELRVDLEADAEHPPIDEDAKILLFQAVRELLFNVVKHAGVDRARLTLRIADGRVVVVVEDAGVGFDPSRFDDARASSGGLGLFSIRERLEALGGALKIDACPGEGTRAEVSVPLPGTAAQGPDDRSHRRAVHAMAKTLPAKESSADPRRRIRVLLADDHKILREGLAGLLMEEPDLEIVGEAGDGLEAVELASRVHPDVVLMDVTMPRLDGIEATARITSVLPQVRVIGLSMHEERDLADAMRAAGAVAYLSKGGSSDRLIATIRSVVADQRDRRVGLDRPAGADPPF